MWTTKKIWCRQWKKFMSTTKKILCWKKHYVCQELRRLAQLDGTLNYWYFLLYFELNVKTFKYIAQHIWKAMPQKLVSIIFRNRHKVQHYPFLKDFLVKIKQHRSQHTLRGFQTRACSWRGTSWGQRTTSSRKQIWWIPGTQQDCSDPNLLGRCHVAPEWNIVWAAKDTRRSKKSSSMGLLMWHIFHFLICWNSICWFFQLCEEGTTLLQSRQCPN